MFRYSRMLLVTGMVSLTALTGAAQTAPTPATAAASAPTVTPDTVVLSIDGRNYTAREFDNIIVAIAPPGTPINESVRRRVAGMIVETRLLADEALRRGLEKDPRVQLNLKLSHEQALGQAVAYQIAQGILEKEARESYEENKIGYERITARHILISTPDAHRPAPQGKPALTDEQAKAKAEEIRQRLLKGEDFATLAAAESHDPSAAQGGAIPPFRRMQMIPELSNAAFELKPGEISAPVKTVFGYHIIQVLERSPAPFDDVKQEIARRLESGIFGAWLEGLKKTHPATLNESYFGPAPQSPPSSSVLMPADR